VTRPVTEAPMRVTHWSLASMRPVISCEESRVSMAREATLKLRAISGVTRTTEASVRAAAGAAGALARSQAVKKSAPHSSRQLPRR
jgi:hypothetical protein